MVKKYPHFKCFIVEIANEIISIIKNRKCKIYNDDHIVTSNNYLIDTKNKHIRKIENDEHVYNRLDMDLYTDLSNIKDVCLKDNKYVTDILKGDSLLRDVLTNKDMIEYINLMNHIFMVMEIYV